MPLQKWKDHKWIHGVSGHSVPVNVAGAIKLKSEAVHKVVLVLEAVWYSGPVIRNPVLGSGRAGQIGLIVTGEV